jgi:hypothetical protein
MKVYLFVFSFIIFFSNNGRAQITKGNWIVGGNLSYNRISETGPNIALDRTSILNITPMAGYFLKDKFVLGLRSEYNNVSANFGDGNRSYTNRLDFGPFFRYYFLPVNNRVNLFSESAYLLTLSKSNLSKLESFQGFLINVGPVIYLNNIVGLEFTLGYTSQYLKGNSGNLNYFRTGIGFQIHLEKSNN